MVFAAVVAAVSTHSVFENLSVSGSVCLFCGGKFCQPQERGQQLTPPQGGPVRGKTGLHTGIQMQIRAVNDLEHNR